MIPGRRSFLQTSGSAMLVGLGTLAGLRCAHADEIIDITMSGTPGGARVWFHPAGVLVQPGQTIRWTNRDPGNSHTATVYHPSLYKKPQRIPDEAQPFDSGFLLPDETFLVTLTTPGVYDYYCLPHEHAGMVGRIIVARPQTQGWQTRKKKRRWFASGSPKRLSRHRPHYESQNGRLTTHTRQSAGRRP